MPSAKFHFKRRTFEPAKTRRWGHSNTYGRWITVSTHDTLDEAHETMLCDIRGLYERAIFSRGRRLTNSNGSLKCGVGR